MLKLRIITAIFIAIPALWLVWNGTASEVLVAAGVVVLLAGLEWAKFAHLNSETQKQLYLAMLAISMYASASYVGLLDDGAIASVQLEHILIFTSLHWLVLLLWVKGYPIRAESWRTLIIRAFVRASRSSNRIVAHILLWYTTIIRGYLGLAILVPVWLALVALKSLPNGHWLLLWLISIVVFADTGAYFAGRKWGKRKLAPNVSPGKTWEGFFGGLACNLVATLAVGLFVGLESVVLMAFIATGVITSGASVLGDLCESMLKRDRGIKDSGTLLPGHGGVMDRIDSLTAAAPVFALCLIGMGWL